MEKKEGIVLKTMDYQENSKIIYLITNNGIDSIIVRGANKLNGKTFLYTHEITKINYELSKDKFLKNALVINSYLQIRTNISKLQSTLKIIEICYVLGNHINDFQLFYTFINQILDLISNNDDYNIIELIFRTKTLYLLGIAPIFNKCVKCGKITDLTSFAFNCGGMKCHSCIEKDDFLYPMETIKIVQKLYNQKLQTIINDLSILHIIKLDHVSHFLDLYYEQYLGFKSKVSKVLSNLSN